MLGTRVGLAGWVRVWVRVRVSSVRISISGPGVRVRNGSVRARVTVKVAVGNP